MDSGMSGMNYTLFMRGEAMVAGLMDQPEESRKMGAPPGWLGYVGVERCRCRDRQGEGSSAGRSM